MVNMLSFKHHHNFSMYMLNGIRPQNVHLFDNDDDEDDDSVNTQLKVNVC